MLVKLPVYMSWLSVCRECAGRQTTIMSTLDTDELPLRRLATVEYIGSPVLPHVPIS
jgi:hypothetical protein